MSQTYFPPNFDFIADGRFSFLHTGLPNATKRQQLSHFFKSLKDSGCAEKRCPTNWFKAFDMLRNVIEAKHVDRKVIFIDELPWLDTLRSDFLMALEAFWNEWASARKDVLFIVCGSAPSWMVKKLFRNRGGLHNRVTARLLLQPFTLRECEQYAKERGIELTRKDIAECYMAIGGIPYYWRHIAKGYSIAQDFNRMFFSESAPLKNEFTELYSSLFRNAPIYMKIVGVLARKKIGMTRGEIADSTGITKSGQLSDALDTLSESGFIRSYRVYGKTKRDRIYQLIDNFTLFHFKFLDGATTDTNFWTDTISSPQQAAWRGLAFERLCLQHASQMQKALGIAGVHTETYAWRHRADETYPQGAQIDLLLDRADNVINVCEMKYAKARYLLDKGTLENLEEKAEVFRAVSKTRKAVHLTMVTSSSLVRNAYANRIQSEVTLDDLFAE